MDEFEQLDMIQTMTGEADTKVLSTFLRLAEGKILERLYPFGYEDRELPSRYAGKAVEIAVYMLNKRGAEGQLSHNENGIYRTYQSADVPDAMLKGIVPMCEVVG